MFDTSYFNLQVHTYPKSTQRFVREHAGSLFLYIATPEMGAINGYRIAVENNMVGIWI